MAVSVLACHPTLVAWDVASRLLRAVFHGTGHAVHQVEANSSASVHVRIVDAAGGSRPGAWVAKA